MRQNSWTADWGGQHRSSFHFLTSQLPHACYYVADVQIHRQPITIEKTTVEPPNLTLNKGKSSSQPETVLWFNDTRGKTNQPQKSVFFEPVKQGNHLPYKNTDRIDLRSKITAHTEQHNRDCGLISKVHSLGPDFGRVPEKTSCDIKNF